MASEPKQKPRLLILGGAFAGATLARLLVDVADVTLVDKKDYAEINFLSPRKAVDPKNAAEICVPFAAMKGIKFVQGTVAALDAAKATLASGAVLEFDYCAICTGSSYAGGSWSKGEAVTVAERVAELEALYARLKAAKSVVVVGGGATGVEMAAEIAGDFPETECTLVHSGPALLPGAPPRLAKVAAAFFKKHGVRVVLSDRVASDAGGRVTLASGQALPADVVLRCTGISPTAPAFMKATMPAALDSEGWVAVDESLRVKGFPHVFALGDAASIAGEHKRAFLAGEHAKLVAKNFRAILAKGDKAKLGKWKPDMGMSAMFLSLGRTAGAGQLFCCACDGMAKSMKSEEKGQKKLIAQYEAFWTGKSKKI